MRYWIYKTNPEIYRITDRLRDPRAEITLLTPRYAELVAEGDIAFLWVAGKERGIVGAANLTSAPMRMEESALELPFYIEQPSGLDTRARAVITHRVALLPSMRLRDMPELMKCSVFHGSQQTTNYMLTEKEGLIFLELVEKAEPF